MAYQIQYGKPSVKERLAIIQNSKKIKIITWAIVGVIILSLGLMGRLGLFDFMIPGDREVTKSAFRAMLDDVKQGESVKSAIAAFCEEILVSAENNH